MKPLQIQKWKLQKKGIPTQTQQTKQKQIVRENGSPKR